MTLKHNEPSSYRKLFTYLMVGSVVCLLIPQRITNKLDMAVSSILSPLSKGSRDVSLVVTDTLHNNRKDSVSYETYQELVDKYQRDYNRLVNISQELRHQREVTEKLSGLKQQFVMERASARFIAANVTGSDTSTLRQTKTIDQGLASQVKTGQIVLGSIGTNLPDGSVSDEPKDVYQMSVVGKVGENPADDSARIQLLSDPGLTLKVAIEPQMNRNEAWRAEGMLKGRGMGMIEVTMISSTRYPVMPGDVVLARADEKFLPVQIIVGTVEQCDLDENNPIMWHITIKPAVDLHSLRKVIIVKSN